MKSIPKRNKTEFWIEYIFSLNKVFPIKLFSGVFIYLPILLLFTPFIIMRWDSILNFNNRMWFGLIAGGICLWFGPLCIHTYIIELRLFFSHIKGSSACVKDVSQIENACAEEFYRFDYLNLLWVCVILCALLFDISYLQRFGIIGYSDPYFYIFCVAIIYISYITSIGFKGVFVTIKAVNSLVQGGYLTVDFFNSDGNGGFRCIKDILFLTTRLFLLGVLLIPILLDYIYYTNNIAVKLILYFSIIVFCCSALLSFLVPLKKAFAYAEMIKENHLNDLGKIYQSHIQCILDDTHIGKEKEELNALNLYNYISLVKCTTLYKIGTSAFIEIAVSTSIPIIGFFVNAEDIRKIFIMFFS